MPNWCFNLVCFQGEGRQLNELERLIQQMIIKEQKEDKGQLFPMVKANSGYLFNIEYHEKTLCYLTKWQPNTEVLTAIADHLGLDYSHHYDEPAMGVYGQDNYIGGELKEAFISLEDHGLYDFDERIDCYLYKGNYYQEVTQIYDLILQEKLSST